MPKKTKQPEVKLSKARANKIINHLVRGEHSGPICTKFTVKEIAAFKKLVTFLIKEF